MCGAGEDMGVTCSSTTLSSPNLRRENPEPVQLQNRFPSSVPPSSAAESKTSVFSEFDIGERVPHDSSLSAM